MRPEAIAQLVKHHANTVGFDLVGMTSARPAPHAGYYKHWLACGRAGNMRYLTRNVHIRSDPRQLLTNARSVICLGVSYRREDGYRPFSKKKATPCFGLGSGGLIAQYARGVDYHVVLRGMLEELIRRLRGDIDMPFNARPCVDTAPILERDWAVAAGLGWFGKNTCVLHPQLGSYLLLAEIVSTLDLPNDAPLDARCGTCTRCIDACPTGALTAPYELDARRCISYLTIEHREAVDPALEPAMGDAVFGCDICQQVCPYNAKAPCGTHPDLNADRTSARLPLVELLELRSGAYKRLARGSALRRARASQWRRNAAIALGNVRRLDGDAQRALASAAVNATDSAVQNAARRSLERRRSGRGVCERSDP